jgi:hypothetical protein
MKTEGMNSATEKPGGHVEPEHRDADRPRGLYGSWISFHLNEAAALWRRCEFGWSNLLALQFVSGVA